MSRIDDQVQGRMKTPATAWGGLGLALVLVMLPGEAQVSRVHLDTLTILDDPFLNLEILQPRPPKEVLLPDTAGRHPVYIKEFYSWRGREDPNFVIMAVPGPRGDSLFIDRNVDDDLTDDGPPLFFPSGRDSITYELKATADTRQRVRLLLARRLSYRRSLDPHTDSAFSTYVDAAGNLNPDLARFVGGMKGEFDFKGTRGSFYFNERVTLRRGTLLIGGKPFSVGLFDRDNNGLFNDDEDVLIVDRRGTGLLTYTDQTQVFKLNDVFPLASRNFRIHDLDKYGTWIDLEETSDLPVSSFIAQQDSGVAAGGDTLEVGPELWNIRGTSFDGSAFALDGYRGEYLLINFWGEWCKPCIAEIPVLVRAAREYSGKGMKIVSFARVGNIDRARRVVADSGMTWPQVLLTDEIGKYFKIAGYPTNILVLPNGHSCVVTHQVNDAFFKRLLQP